MIGIANVISIIAAHLDERDPFHIAELKNVDLECHSCDCVQFPMGHSNPKSPRHYFYSLTFCTLIN